MLREKQSSNVFKLILILIFFVTASVSVRNAGYSFIRSDEAPALKTMSQPQYTDDKRLILPEGYGAWVFVGASIGLSYSEETRGDGPGMFHRVYTQPEAYAEYQRTGKFPEKTILSHAEERKEEGVNTNH